MIKKLAIGNDGTLRLKIEIDLDIMTLSMERKLKSKEVVVVHTIEYLLTTESEMEVIFEEFYNDYLKRKKVEDFWTEYFHNATVIDFNDNDFFKEKKT